MDINPPAVPSGALTRLEVFLLGRFAVAIDDVELAAERWPSLRATQLVQLLSLQPRHRLTRDEVIDALWPQLDPEAGAANLRKAAHHARQALGRHDGIVLQAGEVLLWPERPVTVDAQRFEQRADAALATRDPAECAEAAGSYGGALLPVPVSKAGPKPPASACTNATCSCCAPAASGSAWRSWPLKTSPPTAP